MGKLENELVHDAINANGSANQLQLRICRVVENEIVTIEAGKIRPSDTASQLILVKFHFRKLPRVTDSLP
jgi:hypothetical protein